MVAELVVDERWMRCFWRCEECQKTSRLTGVARAGQVAAQADRHNRHLHPGDPTWIAHDINWANARYAVSHHAPVEWDSSLFEDEQQRSRSRWQT